MYGLLLGLAAAVLFERLARLEEEPPVLWSGLALAAYFRLGHAFGTLWGLAGLLVLGGAFTVRVMTRKPTGRGPTR